MYGNKSKPLNFEKQIQQPLLLNQHFEVQMNFNKSSNHCSMHHYNLLHMTSDNSQANTQVHHNTQKLNEACLLGFCWNCWSENDDDKWLQAPINRVHSQGRSLSPRSMPAQRWSLLTSRNKWRSIWSVFLILFVITSDETDEKWSLKSDSLPLCPSSLWIEWSKF